MRFELSLCSVNGGSSWSAADFKRTRTILLLGTRHSGFTARDKSSSKCAAIGLKIFGKRLYIGLAFAFVGLKALSPKPFLDHAHLMVQLLALLAILGGIAMRAWGSGTAGGHTRSATIEAHQLVTGGPFAHVRNPIYLGTIWLGIGMCALIGDVFAYPLTFIALGILYFTIIPAEEAHLAETFGDEYERYRKSVPMLVPRIRPWSESTPTSFQWKAAQGEITISLFLVAIYLALQWEAYRDRISP